MTSVARIVFVGDISIPYRWHVPDNAFLPNIDGMVGNLEGPILEAREASVDHSSGKQLRVANSIQVATYLSKAKVRAVSLANNHIHDYGTSLATTWSALRQAGVTGFGVGKIREAGTPSTLQFGAHRFLIFGFAWRPTGCVYATKSRQGVNPLTADNTMRTIQKLRKADADSFVVYFLHWNYELELYPQPAHRELAHELIVAGVDAVIACHPHVAQGIEMHHGKPIVYSLGNWLFPPRNVSGRLLEYPPDAERELAVELVTKGRNIEEVKLHWYRFSARDGCLERISAESIDGPQNGELTPFSGMSHHEYRDWFAAHRVRRRWKPIYNSPDARFANAAYDNFNILQQRVVEFMRRCGIRRGL